MVRILFKYKLFLGMVLSTVLVSCYQDGENPYVLWKKHLHQDDTGISGAFSFYYLSPPFVMDPDLAVEDFDATPKLVVDPYDDRIAGERNARIRVEAETCDRDDVGELNHRIDHWKTQRFEKERYLTYVNYYGDIGKMLEMEREDEWVKEIYFNYGEGCVRIFAWTNDQSVREDIEFLLGSFRPGDEDNG